LTERLLGLTVALQSGTVNSLALLKSLRLSWEKRCRRRQQVNEKSVAIPIFLQQVRAYSTNAYKSL
jgi:hypothetical protein